MLIEQALSKNLEQSRHTPFPSSPKLIVQAFLVQDLGLWLWANMNHVPAD
jgi:hypothetical protein